MKRLLALVVLAASVAVAQVTVESKVSSEGFFGQGAFESQTKTMIQGEHQRTETELKFTGSIMKHFSPKGTQIDIIDLEDKVIRTFDDRKKEYREQSFAEIRENFKDRVEQVQWPSMSAETESSDDSEYEWQEPVTKVMTIGGNETVNGFTTDHHLITVTTIGTHKATGKLDTLFFSIDLWNSPENEKEAERVNQFNQRLADELGFARSSQMWMARLAGMYEKQVKEFQNELKDIKGLPVKTDMIFTMTHHATAPEKMEEEPAEEEQDSGIPSGFGSLFGKKVKEMVAPKKEEKADTKKVIFQVTTEVTNLGTDPIDDTLFSVPQDYKLKS